MKKNAYILKGSICFIVAALVLVIIWAAPKTVLEKETASNKVQADEVMATENNEFQSVDEAAAYLRDKLKHREEYIEVCLVGSAATQSGLITTVYETALEHTGIGDEGDYLRFHIAKYSATTSDPSAGAAEMTMIAYTVEYYSTWEQEQAVTAKLKEVMASLNLDNLSDYKKFREIFHYVANHVKYDKENKGDTTRFTAYSALISQKAVCQGFTNLTYRMLLEAGIDNRIALGTETEQNQGHAWNVVLMDRAYYNIDITWDSFNIPYNFQYYLLGTTNFYKTHKLGQTSSGQLAQYNLSTTDYKYDDSDYVITGNCGSIKWEYAVGKKKLRLAGKGALKDFKVSGKLSLPPWMNIKVKSIKVEEGVTAIGDYSFFNMPYLEEVILPSTVTKIGDGAMYRCDKMKSVTIPDTVTEIGNIAYGYYLVKDENGNTTNKKIDGFTIYCGNESAGEAYAVKHSFKCVRPINSLDTPTNFSVSFDAKNINISWDSVPNARKYVLACYKEGETVYTDIAELTDTHYTFQNPESGKYYTFKVRAVLGYVVSSNSEAKGVRFLQAPALVSAIYNGSEVEIKWKEVNGASVYYVYRRELGENNWTKIASLLKGTTSCKDRNPVLGKTYEYIVRAANGSNESQYNTPLSVVISDKPVSPTPTTKPLSPTPTTKPATPTPKPATPTPKPATPTPKPATPTPKPATPTPKPGDPTPTPKPGDPTPTPKPATPTPKPGDPTPTPKSGDPTPTPKPEEEPSIADFVERLYTVALGRPSEAGGKKFWIDAIVSGEQTGADCARFFLMGEEFQNRGLSIEDFVETLYETFFGRPSEAGGKAYWVGQLKAGVDRNTVINGFIDSTEWCNICATYGVRSGAPNAKSEIASKNAINFATRLYTCCLGREPEKGGLDYWSLALTNLEQTGYKAASLFFTSDEFINLKTSNEEYVRRLYTTFMGRDPEKGGFDYWVGELNKGKDRNEVMASFAQCQEFLDICKSYGIERGEIG